MSGEFLCGMDICQMWSSDCSARSLALTGFQGVKSKGLGLKRELFWATMRLGGRTKRKRRIGKVTMVIWLGGARGYWGHAAWFIARSGSSWFPSTPSVPRQLYPHPCIKALQLYWDCIRGLSWDQFACPWVVHRQRPQTTPTCTRRIVAFFKQI